MNKINFVNNSEPALSAENLNQMQNNMEKAGVIVSSTEPTTNEKVWIQKGKNLFNSNSIIWFTNCTNNNGTIIQSTADTNSYLRWKIQTFLNGEYVSNPEVILKNDIGKVSLKFTKDNSFNQIAIGLNGSVIDTLVGLDISDLINEEAYVISFEIINTTQGSVSWNNIQLEQGSTATDYEKYIDKKIYCKNDNGEFEEFVNASQIENRIMSFDVNLANGETYTNENLKNAKIVIVNWENSSGWSLQTSHTVDGYSLNTYNELSCGSMYNAINGTLKYQYSSVSSVMTINKITVIK